MWCAFVVSIGLIAAGTWSWTVGAVTAAMIVGIPYLPYRAGRRRWDRVVDTSYIVCLAEAEQILRGRG
jgi:hypothetical protein